MSTNLSPKDLVQILVEADELIQLVNSDILNEMKAEHRLQLEIQAQNLEKLKSEVQGSLKKKAGRTIGSAAEGMHEALQEIAKAMRELKISFS